MTGEKKPQGFLFILLTFLLGSILKYKPMGCVPLFLLHRLSLKEERTCNKWIGLFQKLKATHLMFPEIEKHSANAIMSQHNAGEK